MLCCVYVMPKCSLPNTLFDILIACAIPHMENTPAISLFRQWHANQPIPALEIWTAHQVKQKGIKFFLTRSKAETNLDTWAINMLLNLIKRNHILVNMSIDLQKSMVLMGCQGQTILAERCITIYAILVQLISTNRMFGARFKKGSFQKPIQPLWFLLWKINLQKREKLVEMYTSSKSLDIWQL